MFMVWIHASIGLMIAFARNYWIAIGSERAVHRSEQAAALSGLTELTE
jgi:hypothetical protein